MSITSSMQDQFAHGPLFIGLFLWLCLPIFITDSEKRISCLNFSSRSSHPCELRTFTTKKTHSLPGVNLADQLQILQKRHLVSAKALILPGSVILRVGPES